jgi:hypothetical protein
MKSKKPKKLDADVEAEIFSISRELLLRELRHYRDSGERVPSALLTSAVSALKATGTTERIAEEAQREEAAAVEFVPRVSATPGEYGSTTTSPSSPAGFEEIEPTDFVSIAMRARSLARQLDLDNPERARLERVAKEAEAKGQGDE